jgi:hypothetical protein
MSEDRAIAIADYTLVGEDLSCAKCGYNLRTLGRGGNCPECGTAVAETLREESLALIPRRPLAIIGIGLTMLLVASLSMSAALVIDQESIDPGVVFTWGLGGPKILVFNNFLQVHLWNASIILGLVSLFVHAIGVFATTWPHRARQPLFAKVSRALLVAMTSGAAIVAMAVARDVDYRTKIGKLSGNHLFWGLFIFDGLCMVLTNIAIAQVVGRRGVRRAMRWSRGLVLTQLVGLVLFIVIAEDAMMIALWIVAITGLGMTILSVWLMIAIYMQLVGLPRAKREGMPQ